MTEKEKLQARLATFAGEVKTFGEMEGVELFLKIQNIIDETERAFKSLLVCLDDYSSLEKNASKETKIIMLMNGWTSPYIACVELAKRIDTNEALLKKLCKAKESTFREIGYTPKAKKANELLRSKRVA